ncbi:MAG: hypothetical protein JJ913_14585 [Rhizobiaceae bacterium]|nr:hypothetical protein [Rhizobiaceae bacterium]
MAGPADDGRWYSGAYSFSDDRGGFRIISVSGVGTSADPFVIVQELGSASPATLTIHAVLPINPTGKVGEWVTGMLHVRVVTLNGSGLPWLGFNFELQEIPGVPSTFGDGLSFDQREMDSDAIGTDRFGSVGRQFEPYDRLEYRDGHVDPGEEASFRFFISDFTPNERFYLVQDPMVPFS